ncbi:photosystem II reaction center proteins PsbY, chloroplastic-like [Phragmites australis]|uniref:photosystem II reaction center proteins PsbY, chloroplastic-like n=1 Tax=Phragmites australis TaxID=29695 RepID=UPI002D792D77|nr:photosystem II reaction center proteins PsbY, chloroplastic-like [Phragmites australis]
MATIATMAMLKPAKILARSAPSTCGSNKVQSVSLRSLQKGAGKKGVLAVSSPAAAAMAGAFFSALASSDAALAAQQIADVAADAGSDNRGTLLLIVVAPAIGWVLYNILQPALNQLNRMRSQALIAGLGLGAAGLACAPEASAVQDLAAVAAAAPADDNRGLLLLIVVAPAIGWVLFNILQPALNQLNRMRSD